MWALRREGRRLGKNVRRGGVRSPQVLWTLSCQGFLDMRSMIDPKLLQEVSQEVLTAPSLSPLCLWEAPPLEFPSYTPGAQAPPNPKGQVHQSLLLTGSPEAGPSLIPSASPNSYS